jgi:hypothetical protein
MEALTVSQNRREAEVATTATALARAFVTSAQDTGFAVRHILLLRSQSCQKSEMLEALTTNAFPTSSMHLRFHGRNLKSAD